MPRIPKNKTPLRLMREAIEQSQKEFHADLEQRIGISRVTYKAYELGQRRLPASFAVQLMILYGVDPTSIMEGRGQPKDLSGRVYSPTSFQTWPGERVYDPQSLITVIQRITDRLIWMLLAARKAQEFTLALHYLEEALTKMHENLHLEPDYQRVLGRFDNLVPKEIEAALEKQPRFRFKKWTPAELYTAGGMARQQRPAFPLSKEAIKELEEVIARRGVCAEGDMDAFMAKDYAFSHARPGPKPEVPKLH